MWLGGAKVSCILRHRGVQLILAYRWGKGAYQYCFLFLRCRSFSLTFLYFFLSFISGTDIEGFNRTPLPFDSKSHFQGKFCMHLINLGYRSNPKYSHPLLFTICFSSTSPFYYLWMFKKIAGWVANSVDPDQMLRSAASDLDLHCLLRLVFPNT